MKLFREGRAAVLASSGTVLLVVLVAGSRTHPLSPRLPAGGEPLSPFRWMSRLVGLSALPHEVQGELAIVVLGLAGAGFLFALREAWRGRVSLRMVVGLGLVFHVVAVLLPLLASEDVYLYGMYGRIAGAHHANPYLSPPQLFPHDVFFPFVTPMWRSLRAPYGPAFILLARTITTVTSRPQSVVLSFKIVSAIASVATMLLVAGFARRRWPERASFATALIALNPAVLFVVVASGHNDALIALFFVIAFWLRVRATVEGPAWLNLASTGALTIAAMIKPPLVLVLVAMVALSAFEHPIGERMRLLAAHGGVTVAVAVSLAAPFLGPHNLFRGLFDTYTVGQYLAPTSFLRTVLVYAHVADTPWLGTVLAQVIRISAFLVFGVIFLMILRLASRNPSWQAEGAAFAWILLFFIITGPQVWPWYFVWILPVAWLLPTIPRLAVVACSAVMPLFESVAPEFFRGIYDNLVLAGLVLVGPALLGLTWVLVKDLIRRTQEGLLLWQDSVQEVHPRQRAWVGQLLSVGPGVRRKT